MLEAEMLGSDDRLEKLPENRGTVGQPDIHRDCVSEGHVVGSRLAMIHHLDAAAFCDATGANLAIGRVGHGPRAEDGPCHEPAESGAVGSTVQCAGLRLHPRDADPKVLALCRKAESTVRFNFLRQVAGPERLMERGDVDLLIIPKEFCSRQHPFEIILEEEFCAIVWSCGELARERLTRRSFAEASHVV